MNCSCGGKLHHSHTTGSTDTVTIRVRRCIKCGNNYTTTEYREELLQYRGKKNEKRLHSKQKLS